jgi:hypothetical protein
MDENTNDEPQPRAAHESRDEYWEFDEKNPYRWVRINKRTMKWIFTIALLAVYVPFVVMLQLATERGHNPMHMGVYFAFITFVVLHRWYTKVWRV